jgi:hypothetical protein
VGKRLSVVAFVIGVATGPGLDGVVFVLAIIVASGASFGVQITAAITFVIAMLTLEEIILVSHPARPAKTQAFLRRLHDWALAHRRKLVAAIFAAVDVSLIAQGNVACVLCFRMSAHFILLLSTPIASQVARGAG